MLLHITLVDFGAGGEAGTQTVTRIKGHTLCIRQVAT